MRSPKSDGDVRKIFTQSSEWTDHGMLVKRGVKVTVILDKSQRGKKYAAADFFRNARIPTYIDDQHQIAHNKNMIIDQSTIITGSFNFTKAAEEKNAENLLVIRGDDALVKKYLVNFKDHLEHSERYEGK